MDFVPWSMGQGFENADDWWAYIRSHTEQDKLDFLIMVALLSEEAALLLLKRDRTLMDRFSFSEPTLQLLSEIDAETLNEFARQLVARQIADEEPFSQTDKSR